MKKFFSFQAMLAIAATSMLISSCSNEDDSFYTDISGQSSNTRTAISGDTTIIDFENDATVLLAGPTSYGENLYADYSGSKYLTWSDNSSSFTCGINYLNGGFNYYNGGIAISNWNIMSNPSSETGDWWYSYLNQCSVYNSASIDGSNENAGHSGSDNFGIMYGYSDAYNASYMSNPEFSFKSGEEFTVKKMYVCNSSYLYGVMKYGNQFGIYGSAVSLEQAKGYFKVLAYGFDANGNATNGGQPVEKYLADYRDGTSTPTSISTTWSAWDLSALGSVNKVKFNFIGSDSGTYGLNTPAYLCIDDIHIY
ncbi:DUF4465 domain-containing protein [uncultured Bacteroides sp.]|uniref:DUF4465 domain-containing protein n=1 Tax=uncultured Bacteroides sp. TaxID=162156 RepID=UPI002AA78639|nr:DUF4465 domain-containing protein [uncultured Bacteroides sp.]